LVRHFLGFKGEFGKHSLNLFLVVLLQRKMGFFQTNPKNIINKYIFFLHMAKNSKVI
jgi:hypothetical protein